MTGPDTQALSQSSKEQVYRRNFPFFLADNILFNVAMSVIGSTTVIPDFVRRLTSSEVLIGLSGSLFTIGNMLPQIFVARYIIRLERKKPWFVGPNIPIRFVILSFAALTVWLGQRRPGLILPAFLACYSIAALGDGVVSVAWADLSGSSLDGRWRARMLGLTTASTGAIMLMVTPLIRVVLSDRGPGFPNNYAALFGVSGALFAVSILPGLFFRELPGGRALMSPPSFRQFLPQLGRVLREDAPYRAFIVVRVLVSLFSMAAPFYIGYATVQLGLSSDVAVPVLLMMQTAGSVAGAITYTWLGATNNLLYLRLALGAACLLPVCALLAGALGPVPLYLGFLMAGLGTSDLLSCLFNWVVGYARPEQRPIYVGMSNTVSGVASLIAPLIGGTVAQKFGYRPLFVISLVMVLGAFFVAARFLRSHKPDDYSSSTAMSA